MILDKIGALLHRWIYLPIAFIMTGRPVAWKNFENYMKEMEKISDSLEKNGYALVKINKVLHVMTKVDGKLVIEKAEIVHSKEGNC